jgi:hypothetical protein
MYVFITLPSPLKMLCPQSILMERPYVFALGGNVFAWFLVLDVVIRLMIRDDMNF